MKTIRPMLQASCAALLFAAASAAVPAAETPAPVPPGAVEGTVVGRPNAQRVVVSSLVVPQGTVRPGQAVTLSLRLEIAAGWHVNSARPTLDYLIPTRVHFPDPGGLRVEEVVYPAGRLVTLKFADEKLSVYEGRAIVRATLRPNADAAPGPLAFKARATYQACSDTTCLPPETVEWSATVTVDGAPVFSAAAAEAGAAAGEPRVVIEGAAESQGSGMADLLERRGLPIFLGIVFLGGLALNLTPCVYPLMPVTIGFFASQAAGGWGRKVALPALYVLGMALTYSALGVAAGLSGGLIGSTLQNRWIVGGLVVLFVVMALSMFGLFELRLPSSFTRLGGGRRGALGALVMGLTMGLVAAPCIGPFVVGLVAFVGASGNPFLGFWLFFVLAIGMGLPNLVLGIFSGALAGLPRSGTWLIYAKKVMGVALLAVAIYFAQPLMGDRALGWLALSFAAAAGLYLAILESTRSSRAFGVAKLGVGIAVVGAGAWLALPLVQARPEMHWTPYAPEAYARALAAAPRRPLVIDFTADWCLACRELERYTFSDPAVMREAERFERFRADLTQFESEPVRAIRDRFGVIGLPTIVFVGSDGNELPDLRLFGFEPPADFLARLRQVR